MADITITDLREDVLDRMDNSVIIAEIPESLRKKLNSVTRVTRALNRAVGVFTRDANPAMLEGLGDAVTLTGDPDVGTAGVSEGMVTYLWPSAAYAERADGGVIKLILDGNEHPISPDNMVPIDSLRFFASSPMYAEEHDAYNLDLVNKRIYALENVTAEARIIQEPSPITDSDTYDGGATLPISEAFFSILSQLGYHELLKTAGSFPNRDEILRQSEPVVVAGAEQEA